MLILVWGIASEGPVRAVMEELNELGATARMIEQRAVLETEMDLKISSEVTGTITVGGQMIDLSQVTACYLRPHDWTGLPDIARAGPNSPAWHHAARIQDTLACWAENVIARRKNATLERSCHSGLVKKVRS